MKSKTFLNFTVIRSGLIVVAAALLLLSLFCDYREQKKMSVDRLRDQLAFTDLLKLESGDYAMERSQLEKYLRYFQLVAKAEPSRADVHAMMGYCYFYLGDKVKAAAEYRIASELNPTVLSFHYNLAAIALMQGQPEKAFDGFKAALTTNPSDNLDFLRNSKIFVYIIYKADLLNASLGERMKQNYALSAYYIVEGFKKSGDPRQAELFRQKMSAAGMEIPKEQGEPRLKVF